MIVWLWEYERHQSFPGTTKEFDGHLGRVLRAPKREKKVQKRNLREFKRHLYHRDIYSILDPGQCEAKLELNGWTENNCLVFCNPDQEGWSETPTSQAWWILMGYDTGPLLHQSQGCTSVHIALRLMQSWCSVTFCYLTKWATLWSCSCAVIDFCSEHVKWRSNTWDKS